MLEYTDIVQKTLDFISPDDDNFLDELIGVTRLFRPFSEAMTDFICEHGYTGDPADTDAKLAFIRKKFSASDMAPPREIRKWFTENQPIRRETAFQICFAFGLDDAGTDDFFRRYYAHERSLNCHQLREAVYYFCLKNRLSYQESFEILGQLPKPVKSNASDEVVYTGQIRDDLKGMTTREELIQYLTEHIDMFSAFNVTAYESIRRMWTKTAGPGGLLLQEREKGLPHTFGDEESGIPPLPAPGEGLRTWDAYLWLFQLNKDSVRELFTDRTIRPILARLHEQVAQSFPDRQILEDILSGNHVSYESVRKWLVLLSFYTFWAGKALDRGNYEAQRGDMDRCLFQMNDILTQAGYPELYVGNPYDWIFFYASNSADPLVTFRLLWCELLNAALEDAPENPDAHAPGVR
ncbi:MAG: hypothetical protein IJ083_18085 [Clostridia bacterium]|nr:hypothetical protein [Clostridia bacterium]